MASHRPSYPRFTLALPDLELAQRDPGLRGGIRVLKGGCGRGWPGVALSAVGDDFAEEDCEAEAD